MQIILFMPFLELSQKLQLLKNIIFKSSIQE